MSVMCLALRGNGKVCYGPLNNTSFKCRDLFICRLCKLNTQEKILEICNNLKKLVNELYSLEILKKLRKI